MSSADKISGDATAAANATAVPQDADPHETREWLEAFESVIAHGGHTRADMLLSQMAQRLAMDGVQPSYNLTTPFRNTISLADQPPLPGDMHMERRLRSMIRWNALMMVMRANRDGTDLGGHIATFASSATLYEIGMNHFFRAPTEQHGGDMIFFQGHAAPGLYARSYLEGRLDEAQLDNFRREVNGGLSSYPHPWLMPDYWQFPTVSMGLGPIQGIYQAHIMRYLQSRDLLPQQDRKVWVFCGDGEMDEPESLGAISLAGREHLDNLIFVVNCNLQRLDGPVRGNGKIIQELEGVFRGAGWNVIKVVWGRRWDPLLAADRGGHLQRLMDITVDGAFQNFKAKGGAYTREFFFGRDPEVERMVSHLSDEEIYALNRGGHDPVKIHAGYKAATETQGRPTVVLAFTVKGYGLGRIEAENRTHQAKKLSHEELQEFRDRFGVPLADDQLESLPYYRPGKGSAERKYLMERREKLGGFLPRRSECADVLSPADDKPFADLLQGSGERSVSTTMAVVSLMKALIKDKNIGERIVPIVPDEARTFGMEGMFRSLGIYSSQGQLYKPEDSDQLAPYRESADGVMLEEGITEAGAFSAWLALATAYSNHDLPMIPFYIFYSMFGFQRIHDLAWAAGDSQARGFLIGATSGRTTLNGEGLQHQDGHSHLMAATIPNCVSYDPAFAGELAVIVRAGLRRMYAKREKVFFYLTTMNENYPQLPLPKGAEEGVERGLYLLRPATGKGVRVRLLGSGAILGEVLAAADLLQEYGVAADVFSATSFTELRRDGMNCERRERLFADGEAGEPWVRQCLDQGEGPVVAATDYMKALADGIRQWVPGDYTVLGTDGFGRSDTRATLRNFFEVDRGHVALAALRALIRAGVLDEKVLHNALGALDIRPHAEPPTQR